MLSRITSTEACVERSRSVSSIRKIKSPPIARANAHGYRAERMLPRWMKPVGDGANRVRTLLIARFPNYRGHGPNQFLDLPHFRAPPPIESGLDRYRPLAFVPQSNDRAKSLPGARWWSWYRPGWW